LALVVLSVVEQRLDAVRAVLAGADVTEVDAFRAEYNTDRPHQALGSRSRWTGWSAPPG
jgi:hypothetical protein